MLCHIIIISPLDKNYQVRESISCRHQKHKIPTAEQNEKWGLGKTSWEYSIPDSNKKPME